MAEYIERDKAINVVINNPYRIAYKTGKTIQEIKEIPTANVVPKSEVDRAYERGFERGKKDNVCGFSAEEIAQKAENIAIELEAMRTAANSYKMHYENLAREIFDEIEKHEQIIVEGIKPVYTIKQRELEELKKKYIQNCTTCKHIVSCEPNLFGICDEYVRARNE